MDCEWNAVKIEKERKSCDWINIWSVQLIATNMLVVKSREGI